MKNANRRQDGGNASGGGAAMRDATGNNVPNPAAELATPLIRKLGNLVRLSPDEVAFLDGMQINRVHAAAGRDFVVEGDDFQSTFVLQSGWAMRYRTLDDGRRQILGFILPGDVIGLNVNFRRRATYSVCAHTDCELALVEPMRILEIYQKFPVLASALNWVTVREYAILAEHAIRLGRRTAYERTVHLLLELYNRLAVIGAVDDLSFPLPVNQSDLADTLGLSLVHMNRTMRRLKGEGAVKLARRRITLHDIDRLAEIADIPDAFLEDFAVL